MTVPTDAGTATGWSSYWSRPWARHRWGDERWVDEVATRFDRAWKSGSRPQIEEYLDDLAEPRRTLLLKELVRVELQRRRPMGEEPISAEYHHRFPDDASVIDAAFDPEPDRSTAMDPDLDPMTTGPVTPDGPRDFGRWKADTGHPRALLRRLRAARSWAAAAWASSTRPARSASTVPSPSR